VSLTVRNGTNFHQEQGCTTKVTLTTSGTKSLAVGFRQPLFEDAMSQTYLWWA
jgi:hypothetical protein